MPTCQKSCSYDSIHKSLVLHRHALELFSRQKVPKVRMSVSWHKRTFTTSFTLWRGLQDRKSFLNEDDPTSRGPGVGEVGSKIPLWCALRALEMNGEHADATCLKCKSRVSFHSQVVCGGKDRISDLIFTFIRHPVFISGCLKRCFLVFIFSSYAHA